MENNREHYFGLSLKECEELYKLKWETFRREWRDPLTDMLKQHVVKRIKSIDGTPKEEVLKYGNHTWRVDLPYYIPLKDEYGDLQWWAFMETPADVRVGSIILCRIESRTEENIEYIVEDLEKVQVLIMWLNRMGFWDDEQRNRFQVL